jgi:threonine dehydratase
LTRPEEVVLEKTTLDDVRAARTRIESSVLRTPLVPWNGPDSGTGLYLKLDNLQPTGSFKVRGAGNALAFALESGKVAGVYTTSAGNMAQALAWHARRLGVPCTVVVPDTAPEVKLAGIRRSGADIVQLPWDQVWEVATTGQYAPLAELTLVHPFNDRQMIAGNGTAGLEILEDLPQVGRVYVPFGGGGLIAGVATAIKATRPDVEVIACEPETAAPFARSLREGRPASVQRVPSFADGIGASNVLPEMWERLRGLVESSRTLSLGEIAHGVRRCFESHHIVVEGAGAASVAAALRDPPGDRPSVALVSGGNIDPKVLGTILDGRVP